MKYLPILLLLLAPCIRPQSNTLANGTHDKTVSDTSVVKDTLSVVDSLLSAGKIKVDTLLPLYQQPLSNDSYFIGRRMIDMNDYRYTGDLLSHFNLFFSRDYGSPGQPNEMMLYGAGSNEIGYFEDGVPINNPLTNSLDLNDVQSEYIDSIEVVPSTRGFLYGAAGNPVSVNFITRDFLSAYPYSRIKYMQGPNGEAFVDGIFNQRIFKKFNLSFDISNRKFDSSFVNTGFSIWQAKIRLKYFLSDRINLLASYSFFNSKVGLNGGVNIDSSSKVNADIATYLYDPTLALVFYPYQKLASREHLFNVKMLGRLLGNSLTDLNIYYKFDGSELNRFQDTLFYKTVNKDKVFGLSLVQPLNLDPLDLKLIGNYEAGSLKYYSLANSYLNYYPASYSNISFSAIASFRLADSSLVPSVFANFSHASTKYNSFNYGGTYSGAGADLTYKLSQNTCVYLGYSHFKTGPGTSYAGDLELGLKTNLENLSLSLRYFRRTNFSQYSRYAFLAYDSLFSSNLHGAGLDFNYRLWNVALETSTSYYLGNNAKELLYLFPQLQFTGGIYYEGILFHSNLNLKAGFKFYYTGRRKYTDNIELSSDNKIDFTMAGVIQDVATIYFTWENLLGTDYYIMPYYPMPSRGFRFGISWILFD